MSIDYSILSIFLFPSFKPVMKLCIYYKLRLSIVAKYFSTILSKLFLLCSLYVLCYQLSSVNVFQDCFLFFISVLMIFFGMFKLNIILFLFLFIFKPTMELSRFRILEFLFIQLLQYSSNIPVCLELQFISEYLESGSPEQLWRQY